jgi:probable F420-dependent oxidoreductase
MKVGITLPNIGPQATRDNIIQLATQAEEEGFDSLWTIRRILWPLKPQSSYAVTPDGALPAEYQSVLDALDVLAYVAANTSNVALGTHVENMFFFTPIMLAKRLTTLDVLSQGRIISGLGLGWSKDEYQASNIPFQNRGERADEFIEVLNKIWTEDVVEFKGKYYNIPASKIDPKPIQRPHIPIYLGGSSPNTFARIAKYDLDGWLGAVAAPLENIENWISTMKTQANQQTKTKTGNFRIIMVTFPDVKEAQSSTVHRNRVPLSGTVDEVGSDIERLKAMGVEHVIFNYNFLPIGRDVAKIIHISKELSKFAR